MRSSSPTANSVATRFDPPYETSGSGNPLDCRGGVAQVTAQDEVSIAVGVADEQVAATVLVHIACRGQKAGGRGREAAEGLRREVVARIAEDVGEVDALVTTAKDRIKIEDPSVFPAPLWTVQVSIGVMARAPVPGTCNRRDDGRARRRAD